MLKNLLWIAIIVVLLTASTFAKDIQVANLSATMECNRCKNVIEKTLNKTDGVENVTINLKEQSVSVKYDKDVISEEQLIAIINKADLRFSAKSSDKKSCSTEKANSNVKQCTPSCSKKCTKN